MNVKNISDAIQTTDRAAVKVRIYCVGGTGIDIISPLFADGSRYGMEHVSFSFVDTSDSNIRNVDPDSIYRFPGLQGGGKNREYIVQKTRPHIADLLKKHAPADVNIVVIGGAGASGAGAGPLIVRELMNRGQNILIGLVGTKTGSSTELNNTIATIQTLANYTKATKIPLATYYLQNDENNSMGSVDEGMRSMIRSATALFSNKNHGLEITDMTNFLNYNRQTAYDAALVNFDFFLGQPEVPDHMQAIAQITLEDASMAPEDRFDIALEGVAYRASGVMDARLKETLTKESQPLNFILTRGGMAFRLKELRARLVEIQNDQALRAEAVEDIDFDGEGEEVY